MARQGQRQQQRQAFRPASIVCRIAADKRELLFSKGRRREASLKSCFDLHVSTRAHTTTYTRRLRKRTLNFLIIPFIILLCNYARIHISVCVPLCCTHSCTHTPLVLFVKRTLADTAGRHSRIFILVYFVQNVSFINRWIYKSIYKWFKE